MVNEFNYKISYSKNKFISLLRKLKPKSPEVTLNGSQIIIGNEIYEVDLKYYKYYSNYHNVLSYLLNENIYSISLQIDDIFLVNNSELDFKLEKYPNLFLDFIDNFNEFEKFWNEAKKEI